MLDWAYCNQADGACEEGVQRSRRQGLYWMCVAATISSRRGFSTAPAQVATASLSNDRAHLP